MRFILAAIPVVFLALAAAAPSHAAMDCAAAEEAARAARKAADLPAARGAFDAAQACDGMTRQRIGLMTAQTCFNSLLASGRPVDAVEDQLRACLGYGRDWRALRELADLDFRRQKYDEAARGYDDALAVIAVPELVPTRPSDEVLNHLYEHGDAARGLAAQFRRSTRSADGKPAGLGSLGTRGFVPKRRQLSVRFEFDSTAFTEEGRTAATELRDALATECHGRTELVGHTDDQGEEAYNLRLSRQRADALLEFVRKTSLPDDCRLEASGRGEAEPPRLVGDAESYSLDQKRALARRVEVRRD